MKRNRRQRHMRKPGHVFTRASVLALMLLSWFVAACNLPFQSVSLAPPPPPGQVLYVLSRSTPTQQNPQPAASMTYVVTALRSNTATRLWQSAALTLAPKSAGSARIVSGGSLVYVSISAPQMSGTPTAGEDGRLIALDAQTGKVLWKVEADGANLQHLTVGATGNLYAQVDNRLEALDRMTGARLWSATTDATYQITQLLVTKGAVIVEQEAYFLHGSQQGDTYDSAVVRALRPSDGHQLWRQEVANTDENGLLGLTRVSVQADEQTVYLLRVGQVQETHGNVTGSFPRTTLFALNIRDGSHRWSNQTQRGDAGQDFDLFHSGQTLYVRGVASPGMSSLSAFQSQDGARLWTWQTPFVLNPFEPPDHIYGSSLNRGETFCALKSSNGNKAWCAAYNQAGRVLFGQGRIYLVAFKISYQGDTIKEQPLALYILDERDGSLIAQYMPGRDKGLDIEDLALS